MEQKYECIIQISYTVEGAKDKDEAVAIAEQMFYEDTHLEISGIDVNPIN